jgi:hypothetical protein
MFSGSSSSYGRMLDCGAIVGKGRSWPTADEGRKEHEQAHLHPLELVCKGRHAVFTVPLQ